MGGRRGLRLFRVLLRLYPADFRARYGAEMTEYAAARLERARGRGRLAALLLWLRSAADVVRTAAAERRGRRRGPGRGRSSGAVLHDARYAARRLAASPLFTLSSILILAIAIGLNTAAFSVVDALLFRPAPYTAADRIVHIYQDADEGGADAVSFPAYREMAGLGDVFSAVAATSPAQVTWDDGSGLRELAAEFATSSYLAVLGLSPTRGRWFDAEHDHVGSDMVAVLSHAAWRRRFGADPDVIGRTLRLNSRTVTVIGVGPAGYNGEAGTLVTDVWLSISSTPVGGPYRVANLDRREDHWYLVKARLAPGAGIGAARAAVDALAMDMASRFPDVDGGRGISVFAHDGVRLHPRADAQLVPAALALAVTGGLILLLACSNLANLLLVRGSARASEVAVRLALGAGRGAIVRLLLLEAALLSALGTAAGVLLALVALRGVASLRVPLYGGLDVGIDARVLVFSTVLSAATALLFGLVPAWRATRPGTPLATGGRGATPGPRVSLLRGGLVAAQVAISFALVVGTGLFARSLANAVRVDPGVDAARVVVIGTDLAQGGVNEEEYAVTANLLLERLAAVPGVEATALTSRLPLQRGGTTTQVVDGYAPAGGTGSVELPFAFVSRDYFRAMGIATLAGRTFGAEETAGSRPVAVISETAARRFWNGAAEGGRIRRQAAPDAWREVVGVVTDVKVAQLHEPPAPMIYFPAEHAMPGSFTLVVRTAAEPRSIMPALRAAVQDVRATLPITRLEPFDDLVGASTNGARAATGVIAAFSLLALLLACVGIHAVVAFTVAQRRTELSIRAALGAAGPRLASSVLREPLLAVGAGLSAGVLLAAVVTGGVESLLFGVRPLDAGTFAAAALVLLGAALAAAAVPAARAGRSDPANALRGS